MKKIIIAAAEPEEPKDYIDEISEKYTACRTRMNPSRSS